MTPALIARKIDQLAWRHRIWGVDERQAWYVIRRLDEMYRQLDQNRSANHDRPAPQADGVAPSAYSPVHAKVSGVRSGTAAAIKRRSERTEGWRVLRSALLKVVAVAIAVIAVFTFVLGLSIVRGTAMAPTMGDGDLVLFSRVGSVYSTDDIVTYRPQTAGQEGIGRVVAQPGDVVEVTSSGDLLVNGTAQEPPNGEITLPESDGPSYPITLGEGEYFVLGDNRTESTDSRTTGPIGIAEIEGKVVSLLRFRGI